MDPTQATVVTRMDRLIRGWEPTGNQLAIFLRCYRMMTVNTLTALERGEFTDPRWVDRLLHRFADYYFDALSDYQGDPIAVPAIWRMAHDSTRDAHVLPVQNLLLGVNAHINYDLVLTLDELLSPEWGALNAEARAQRYQDYIHINDIIGRTIDRVQDDILDVETPALDIFDRLLGPLDELLISKLITHWRENVWQHANQLMEAPTADQRAWVVSAVEEAAVRIGRAIRP